MNPILKKIAQCSIMFWMCMAFSASAADEFLEPEQAFKFSAHRVNEDLLLVRFDIAPGYHMYRDRFSFSINATNTTLGNPEIPKGKIEFDKTFNKNVETYRDSVEIRLPVTGGKNPFRLSVISQGCADAGLCYQPMPNEIDFSAYSGSQNSGVSDNPPSKSLLVISSEDSVTPNSKLTTKPSESYIDKVLASGNLALSSLVFFGLGLLLAFTPCVLPMVPILSSIIVGEGKTLSRKRGLLLSSAYVLGMALVYSATGIAAGLLGEGLTAAMQNPWVLGSFAALLFGLSLSMFGLYELQLPAFVRDRLSERQQQQKGGKFVGVFAMGALSAIIVGPCVTAPLAGVLTFIAQTHNAVFGGAALFSMALGMGAPLLLVGIGAGQFLPHAGGWMENVKRLFGVLLIGVSIWMITPVIPTAFQFLLWALLFSFCAGYLLFSPQKFGWMAKTAGSLFAITSTILLVGVATGGQSVLQPLAHLKSTNATEAVTSVNSATSFDRIHTLDELNRKLTNTGNKPVMLDFYADWCVSCKEMERFTFSDEKVAKRMAQFVRLQVDVTGNNENDRLLLKKFGLFGPPGIVFFDSNGAEIRENRVIGFQDANHFIERLDPML